MPTRQRHPRRRLRTMARWAVLATVVATAFAASGSAEARCVTVGADGITHTQCRLP